MKQKKLQLWLPLLLSAVMVAGMVIGYKLRKDTAGANAFLSNYHSSPVAQILDIIDKNYVDNVNTDSLQSYAINKLLSRLDPHSVYIPASQIGVINDESKGVFTGIGIGFELINDSVYITDVTKGSPAFKAGVQVGDKFLVFDDSLKLSGPGRLPEGVVSLLRRLGSPIKVSIQRSGKILETKIEKTLLPIPSIDAAYMLDVKTGYVRLNKFSQTTYKEFMYALEMLKRKGMQQLIIDLRGNAGGVMTAATEIANEFLKQDQLIVYTDGVKTGKKEYRCTRDGLYTELKLEVLIDETSASASEILAGALQDWDRATIIGRRSFGKGLVENQFRLNNGAALRLTVARYYTPLGRNIQKPYRTDTDKYKHELATRFHDGETVLGDTSTPKGKSFKTPKGRIVYGGGGITPDIFVPYDTTLVPKPAVQLYLKGVLTKFAFLYYLQHAEEIKNIPAPAQVDKQLQADQSVWPSLTAFAIKDSIDLGTVNVDAKNDVLEKFRAFVAKDKFGPQGYFEVNNLEDEMVQKALQNINR